MEKKAMTHIAKGFIASAVMITFDVVGIFLHYSGKVWELPVLGCILLGSVIWGCITFSKQTEGPVTFGTVFTHGFRMTAVITCLCFVYTLLVINIFFPGTVDGLVKSMVEEAKKSPGYSQERVNQNIGMARTVIKAIILAGTVVATLAVGVIGVLVGSVAAQNISRPSSQKNK